MRLCVCKWLCVCKCVCVHSTLSLLNRDVCKRYHHRAHIEATLCVDTAYPAIKRSIRELLCHAMLCSAAAVARSLVQLPSPPPSPEVPRLEGDAADCIVLCVGRRAHTYNPQSFSDLLSQAESPSSSLAILDHLTLTSHIPSPDPLPVPSPNPYP